MEYDYRQIIDRMIEEQRKSYTDISDQIWDFAESRFEEVWSSKVQQEYLQLVVSGFRQILQVRRQLLLPSGEAESRSSHMWVNLMHFRHSNRRPIRHSAVRFQGK